MNKRKDDLENKPLDKALLEPAVRFKKLVTSAEQMKSSNTVPLIRYYRTLLGIEKMARSYLDDMALEKAFILFYRFAWFAVEELKNHAEYPYHESEEKKNVLARVEPCMQTAEKIRDEIKKVYEIQSVYYNFENDQRMLRLSNFDQWILGRQRASVKAAELLRDAQAASQRIAMQMGVVLPYQVEPDMMHSRSPDPNEVYLPAHPNKPSPETTVAVPKVSREVTSPVMEPGTSASSAFKPVNKFASEYPAITDEPETTNELSCKTVAVAHDLPIKFLTCAAYNTMNNIETCGVLGGTLLRGRMMVTHVLIPKQSGTSDGCTSEDDVGVMQILESSGLFACGWIHTHPSQTAFLSSIDLHTQYSYQKMLSTAVAIVCATSQNELGTFCLTPQGMNIIENCHQRGFHPHSQDQGEIFTNAAHVHYSQQMSATVIDLRII